MIRQQFCQIWIQHGLYLLSWMFLWNCQDFRLNSSNTEGMWVGSSRSNKLKPFGIKWSDERIKALGVYYTYDIKLLHEKNFIERLDSVKKFINIWSSRGLSLYGKVTIIKSLITYSQICLYFVTSPCTQRNCPRVKPNVI